MDKTGETLTLAELESKSRRLASVFQTEYDILPKDVVGILAKDKVQALFIGLAST